MSSTHSRPVALLVEDSEDDAFFFRWSLKKCGLACDLVHAADGAAAIKYLEGVLQGEPACRRPDLVFLDLKLPAFSGFEVLSWINERHFEPSLDVAVLSGSEHAGDVERALALGATEYFVKPISVQQLNSRFAAWQAKQSPPQRRESEEAHAIAGPRRPE